MSLILGTFFVNYLLPSLWGYPLSFVLSFSLLDVMAGTGATILDLEMTMTLGVEVKHNRETRQESLSP